MNSQITLSLRSEIIQKAKEAARKQGISPSDYLVRFLEKVLVEPLPETFTTAQIERLSQSAPKRDETPLETIQRLSEGISPMTDEEYAQRKRDYLMKKYG